jgi:hypothetical protein
MGIVNLSDLGARGVNTGSDPLHQDPSELTQAQNAEYSFEAGQGSLDQRPGMSKINSTALNSGAEVCTILDVPYTLQSDTTAYLYAGTHTTGRYRRSNDGATWANTTSPVIPQFASSGSFLSYSAWTKQITIGRKMYFVDTASPPAIRSWDGATDRLIATIPANGNVLTSGSVGTAFAQPVGVSGATTYSYVIVAKRGTDIYVSNTATMTNGNAVLSGSNFNELAFVGPTTSAQVGVLYDIYRTAGGATQGKILSNLLSSQFTAFSNDTGLAGSGSVPTATAAAQGPWRVMDMTTDGTDLYLVVADSDQIEPYLVGRILKLDVVNGAWTQLGLSFPRTGQKGVPSALAFYDGALNYGTYSNSTGNQTVVESTGFPMAAGGVQAIHSAPASRTVTAMAVYRGELYVAYLATNAAAAIVEKLTEPATWTTVLTAPGTAANNAFTSLHVYNDTLYAGWAGAGAVNTLIYAYSPNYNAGAWVLDVDLGAATYQSCQMITFQGSLYAVLGETGGAVTANQLLKRTVGPPATASGLWTTVDAPADDFNGGITVVYT